MQINGHYWYLNRPDKHVSLEEGFEGELTCDCGGIVYLVEDDSRQCDACGRRWYYEVTVYGPAKEEARE